MKKSIIFFLIFFSLFLNTSINVHGSQPVRAQLAESIPLVGIDKVHQRYGLTGAGVKVYIIDHFSEDNPRDHGWFVKAIIESIAPSAQVSICDMHLHDAFKGPQSCMMKLLNNPVLSKQIDLINASFVSGSYSNQGSKECALEEVLGRDEANVMSDYLQKKLLIAAVGNNDISTSLLFPACLPEVLSVGASLDSGERIDELATFSNRPPFMDLVAPGAPRVTPWPDSHFSGTSAATPIVTGIAALILEADTSLTPAQIMNLLIKTGDLAYDPSSRMFHPRVNAVKAVQQIRGRPVVPNSDSVPDIEIVSVQIQNNEVIQGEQLCVDVQLFNHGGDGSFNIEILQDGIKKLSTSRSVRALQEVNYEVCYSVFLVGQHQIEIKSSPLNQSAGTVRVLRDTPKLPPVTLPPIEGDGAVLIFDDNHNALIDDSEFFSLVDLWISEEISDELFFRVIDVWIGRVRLQRSAQPQESRSFNVYNQLGVEVASGACSIHSRQLASRQVRFDMLSIGVYLLVERDCKTGEQRVSFFSNMR